MPKLLISHPSGDVSHELTGEIITIGRTPDNKIQVNHHSVSAHHARLQFVNGKYRFKDLDSTNRSCINNIPVSDAELTGSCFIRLGNIECVYKLDAASSVDPVHSQLAELQRQMESLMKARDQIHQQNASLKEQCERAKQDTDEALEKLAELQNNQGSGTFQPATLLPTGKLNVPAMRKNGDAEKKIQQLTQERDALIVANNELKASVELLTVQLREAGGSVSSRASSISVPMPVMNEVQQRAADQVKEAMDESVEDYEEEEVAQVASAGGSGSSTRVNIPGKPLFGGLFGRNGKPKGPEEQPEEPNNITSMPSQASVPTLKMPAPAPMAEPAPIPAPAPAGAPSLRIIPPPSANGGTNGSSSTSNIKHRAGAAAANAAPQNPGIKPAWDTLNAMRRSLHYFLRHQDELAVLEDMEKNARYLTDLAKVDLLKPIAALTTALESLVRDQQKNPKNVNPSSMRTIGQCIDFLAVLIEESNLTRLKDVTNAKIFAIDDDGGVLDIITSTMELANLNITTAAGATDGLAKLSAENYELILLDVGLPDMNGMDICSRVRAMPQHHKTPIVFLTGEATVQNRVQSTLNGGNDMIGKPFSVLELAVKALTWVFKGQLGLV
ncbi:MAG: response regulator [Chthoniobacteraceae bacterium]